MKMKGKNEEINSVKKCPVTFSNKVFFYRGYYLMSLVNKDSTLYKILK